MEENVLVLKMKGGIQAKLPVWAGKFLEIWGVRFREGGELSWVQPVLSPPPGK